TCASRSPPPPRRCHHHPKGTGAASGAAAWDPSPGRVGLCRLALRPSAQDARNSTFQTYKKEVCLPGHSIHAAPWAILQDPICCECQTRFGGCLPVPRAEAALPYWVPLSLRPRKQHPRWMHVSGTTACRSVVMGACCPNGCSRLPTRTSCWLLQHTCCPSAS
uniref:Chromosome 16 open reading frame 95 n=1 Tax=Callithrix jacchus TaxID=9483 RepID=F7HNF4_CALJA